MISSLDLQHFSQYLAVPNNAVFCITPALFVIRSFSIHPSNSFVSLPNTPIITSTTSTIFSLHNLSFSLSLFRSWYFSSFSVSFSPTLTSAGTAISMIIPFPYFLSIKIMSGLVSSITLSY